MKKIVISFIVTLLLTACAPSLPTIETAIAETQAAYTAIPTYTLQPTYTPQPKIVVTRVVVRTPVPQDQESNCKPITNMDYSNNTNVAVLLQAYVSQLPGVQSVSLVYPRRLYSNSLSESFHVSYINSDDGKVYSKSYIVYLTEFGWKNGVFSIDGQCWIDPPH